MPSPSFAQSNAMSVGLNRTKITAQGLNGLNIQINFSKIPIFGNKIQKFLKAFAYKNRENEVLFRKIFIKKSLKIVCKFDKIGFDVEFI